MIMTMKVHSATHFLCLFCEVGFSLHVTFRLQKQREFLSSELAQSVDQLCCLQASGVSSAVDYFWGGQPTNTCKNIAASA